MKQGVRTGSFIAIFLTFCLCPIEVFAETYQWTDNEGTINFSDNPVNAPKGKSTVIRQEEQGSAPANYDRETGSENSLKPEKKVSKTKIINDQNKAAPKHSTINFNPGNYEVKNWMEIPGKGLVKQEKDIHCLTESDIGWKMYRESDCELLSESTQGNTISWEFKCGYNGVDTVSGSITYFGDSFNGVMMYRNDKGNLKIGLSGNRIGNCAESKKKETAEEGSRSEAEKEPEKDPAIEAEIREVWRQYNAALARNDAVSAANYIALRERGGCLETFVALGNKLNQLNNENEEFEIDYIRDGHARAVVIRIEEVLGRKERVGYPVHFYKEDGVWEMDKC